MTKPTVTAFISLHGKQEAHVDVYHAGTPSAYIAVRTAAVLTYCYNRAAVSSNISSSAFFRAISIDFSNLSLASLPRPGKR